MRILISADMEGVTGVTWGADVKPGTPGWERFRPVFTGDVNACISGLVAGGATDILVNEAHSSQRNLLIEELDVRARMLTGRHKPLSMMQGIDSGVDGVVFLGYHAAAGQQGVLAHTYLENSITGVWLDGVLASEGRLNAALAAEHGVPVLMITGDDRCCEDAAAYVPEAERVAVKECVSRYAAICLPPTRSWELIISAAQRSMNRAGRGDPVPGPHRIEVEFDAAHLAMAAAVIPTVEQVDVLRVGFDAPDMTEAMKCFKIVTAIAAGATEPEWG
ncbi:M55 family metallopeptidase [Crossiella sp. SN42]|uniref:M55 family metallopeptidase n=1 Tax=Crossiella sp. SN42 TaxID=2944808 RepID=UPI00207C971B|nr:M55 family metallopeptidase [Crossiella sp. SN42]MCO1576226.1 M55 family metallopeptidase [Crossiella sp. SN42]